jgi:hypothetical protein
MLHASSPFGDLVDLWLLELSTRATPGARDGEPV